MTDQANLIKCEALTPEQARKWGDVVSMMAWVAPGFRHLWYKLLAESNKSGRSEHVPVFTRGVPYAATDGSNIFINPDTYFKWSIQECVFVAAHEVMHNVFMDCQQFHHWRKTSAVPCNDGTTLPWDEATMQKVADFRINAALIKGKIGRPPKEGHFDNTLTGEESIIDLYQKHYKPKPKGEPEGQPGSNPGGFDSVQKPGQSSGQSAQQAVQAQDPRKWQIEIAVAQALEERKAGSVPGALSRLFKQILEPEVPWQEQIETLVIRHTNGGEYDWTHPDPLFIWRDIYLPAPTDYGAGWIVVWGDTSGSRSDKELASNMAELAGMLDGVKPRRLTVIWCDAAVNFVDEIEDPRDLARIQARGTGGGGGTKIAPVFDWIGEQHEEPDMFIGFTDGEVRDLPKMREPPFPVIWASSTDCAYPWGKVVRVNKEHK